MKSSQYSKLNKINNFYIQVNMAFSVMYHQPKAVIFLLLIGILYN